VLIYAGLWVKENYIFFLFESAVCQVTFCLFTIVSYSDSYYLLVGPTDLDTLVWFFCDIFSLFLYVIKLTIILIIVPLSTFVKFSKIPQNYPNFEEKGKFHGSAWNFVARRKLWALLMIICKIFVKSLRKSRAVLYLLGCSLLSWCCSRFAMWSCYITASSRFTAWCWYENGEYR